MLAKGWVSRQMERRAELAGSFRHGQRLQQCGMWKAASEAARGFRSLIKSGQSTSSRRKWPTTLKASPFKLHLNRRGLSKRISLARPAASESLMAST